MLDLTRPRSFTAILTDGCKLYGQTIVGSTGLLVLPVLFQVVGSVLFLALPYTLMNVGMLSLPLLLVWPLMLLACVPGAYLLFKGFWDYLLWFSALNLWFRDLIQDGQAQAANIYKMRLFSRAADFSLIWCFFFALSFIPIGLGVCAMASTVFGMPLPGAIGLAVLIFLLAALIAFVVFAFVSLSFQTMAFTPDTAGACMVKSADLVSAGVLKTFGIVIVTLLATQLILPFVFDKVMQLLHVYDTFTPLVLSSINPIVSELQNNFRVLHDNGLLTGLEAQPIQLPGLLIASTVTQLMIGYMFGALLLPLGSAWFFLLYWDLRGRLPT